MLVKDLINKLQENNGRITAKRNKAKNLYFIGYGNNNNTSYSRIDELTELNHYVDLIAIFNK